MRARLFIRIAGDDTATVQWLVVDSAGNASPPRQDLLQDVAAQAPGHEVVVLVPTTRILLTSAAVPSRNRQRIAEAIPYVLEEQLVSDVEDLHFALGQRGEDGRVNVAVVDQGDMAGWLDALQQANIRPDALVPDVLAVPLDEEAWTLVKERAVSLLRSGVQSGYAFDTENIAVLLPAAFKTAATALPARLHVVCGDDADDRLPELPIGVEAQTGDAPSSVLNLLARGYDSHSSINLLQGAYSRQEQIGKLWRPWRPAAAMLLVWLVLQAAMTVTEYVQLKQQEQTLRQQVEQTFRQAFPDARNVHISSVKPRMEQQLRQLRSGDSGAHTGFLGLLAEIGTHLASDDSLQLQRLSFNDGQLDLAIQISDLQRLDDLKRTLSANTDYSVNIQSASARATGVEARLQIRQKSS